MDVMQTVTETSDATLLEAYASERSQDAFAQVVRRHIDGVYGVARRRVRYATRVKRDPQHGRGDYGRQRRDRPRAGGETVAAGGSACPLGAAG